MTVESVENVSKNETVADAPKETVNNTAVKTPSPAADLREIQNLLVNGIFPGQVAPSVVKSFQLLEKMALQIEAAATVPQETK